MSKDLIAPLDLSQLDRQLGTLRDCLKQPDTEQGRQQQEALQRLLPILRAHLQARVVELGYQEDADVKPDYERLAEIEGEMAMLNASYIECLKIWGRVKLREWRE